MAFSVVAVSISVSPFDMEDDFSDMFITVAPSRLAANSKLAWVRVDASKNRLISVRSESVRSTGARAAFRSASVSARSSRAATWARSISATPSRCGNGNTGATPLPAAPCIGAPFESLNSGGRGRDQRGGANRVDAR